MDEPTDQKRGKVPLRSFLQDFQSSMPDQELMRKYDLSAQAFVSLVKALLAKKVVTHRDLAKRKEMAVQRDLAKESQFLAGLFICSHCGHPHPARFETCPACGAPAEEFAPAQDVLAGLTTSSGQVKVAEDGESEDDDVEVTEEVSEVGEENSDSDETDGEIEVTESESDETPLPREVGAKPDQKASALESVRSFFSKKLKKK